MYELHDYMHEIIKAIEADAHINGAVRPKGLWAIKQRSIAVDCFLKHLVKVAARAVFVVCDVYEPLLDCLRPQNFRPLAARTNRLRKGNLLETFSEL